MLPLVNQSVSKHCISISGWFLDSNENSISTVVRIVLTLVPNIELFSSNETVCGQEVSSKTLGGTMKFIRQTSTGKWKLIMLLIHETA